MVGHRRPSLILAIDGQERVGRRGIVWAVLIELVTAPVIPEDERVPPARRRRVVHTKPIGLLFDQLGLVIRRRKGGAELIEGGVSGDAKGLAGEPAGELGSHRARSEERR